MLLPGVGVKYALEKSACAIEYNAQTKEEQTDFKSRNQFVFPWLRRHLLQHTDLKCNERQ